MKRKSPLALLLILVATTSPLLSASEVDRLRALCAEQELQISQLEQKIAHLSGTPTTSPSTSTTTRQLADVSPSKSSRYTVKPGDSIARIARIHSISVESLAKLNNFTPTALIHPGQELKVSTGKATPTTQTASQPASPARTHTVVPGDTLHKISQKYSVSTQKLTAANPTLNPTKLRIGQKIQIEGGRPPASPIASKPAPSLSSSASSIPISNSPAPIEKTKAPSGPVQIDKEITYGQFASNNRTTTARLDELNGLELDPSTVLAKGSELYIPAQP